MHIVVQIYLNFISNSEKLFLLHFMESNHESLIFPT